MEYFVIQDVIKVVLMFNVKDNLIKKNTNLTKNLNLF